MPTLYVSPTGSDQHAGTASAPLQTLAAARERVRHIIQSFSTDSPAEDITVKLEPGMHRLRKTLVLGPQDSGNENFKVIWEGSTDGETVITSGVPLSGWTRCEDDLADLPEAVRGKVWYLDFPPGTEVNTLYGPQGSLPRAKGPAMQPVRIPPPPSPSQTAGNFGPDGPITGRTWADTATGIWHHDRFGFAEGALKPASDFHEAEVLIIPAMQWTMNILPIAQVDFDKRIVTLAKPCTYPIGTPHCAPEGSIWLENSLSVLSPGHWVYHASTARLYYCPASGSNSHCGHQPAEIPASSFALRATADRAKAGTTNTFSPDVEVLVVPPSGGSAHNENYWALDAPEPDLEAGTLVEYIRIEGEVEIGNCEMPVKGIHLRNLTFTRSNRYRFHGLTGKGIQHDWEMHDATTCMVRLRHAENCSVKHCRFVEGGSGGVRLDLACRGNRVAGCEFANLGGCGIVLCGYGLSRNYRNRNNEVLGNHLHHLGLAYWHCPGIFIWQSGENHIADNHIHDLPYTGIVCSGRTLYDRDGNCECSRTIDWQAVEEQCGKGYVHNVWHYSGLPCWWMREPLMHSRDNLIEYNRIHDVMQIMGDGNAIYISGAGGGNVVRFNVVGPCPSPTFSEGIRCDDDQHHTILHGNLIYQLGGRATGITLKGINRVTNNIIAMPLTTPFRGFLSLETGPLNGSVIQRNIFLTSAPDQRFVNDLRIHGQGRKARLRDTESDRNIYWCLGAPEAGPRFLAEAQSFGTDTDSLAADPGFVDPQNGNFHLKPEAAARQTGFQELPLERMFKHGSHSQTSATRGTV